MDEYFEISFFLGLVLPKYTTYFLFSHTEVIRLIITDKGYFEMNQNGPRELFPAFEFKEARLLRTKEFVFYVTYLPRA